MSNHATYSAVDALLANRQIVRTLKGILTESCGNYKNLQFVKKQHTLLLLKILELKSRSFITGLLQTSGHY